MKTNLLYFELRKLLSLKYVAVFVVVLLAINAGLFSLLNKNALTAAPDTIDAVNQSSAYADRLDEIIQKAERNLLIYESQGYRPDTFLMKSQQITIEQYSKLYDSEFSDGEINQGTSAIFTYDTDIIFCLLAAILAVASIFYIDIEQGTIQFIRDTKHGGTRLYLAKTACSLIVSIISGLLFLLTDFAIMQIYCGSLPISQPIQIYSQFALCPYNLTVGEAFLLSLLWRVIFSMFIALLIGFMSVVIRKKLLTRAACFVFAGVNFFIAGIAPERSLMSGISLFNAAAFPYQLEDLRVLPVFGTAVEYIAGVIGLWLFTGIISGIGILVVSNATKVSTHTPIFASVTGKINALKSKKHIKSNSAACAALKNQSLSLYELIKLRTSTKLIVVIVLIFVKLVAVYNTYYTEDSYDTQAYKEYPDSFTGQLSNETIEEIDNTRERINKITNDYNNYLIEYQKGSISHDEYLTFKNEYYETKSFETIFERVEQKVEYLSDIRESTGIDGWIFYDNGWPRFFNRAPDFILLVLLISLLSDISSMEYGSMYPVLRTLKKGRHPVIKAKLRTGALLSITFSLLFSMIDLAFIGFYYGIYSPFAPVASIMDLGIPLELPVCAVAFIAILLQTAGYVLISNIIVCLSTVIRKLALTISLSSLIVALPYLFNIGHGGICGLIDGHTLLLTWMKQPESYGWTYFALCIISIIAASSICSAVTGRSREKQLSL